MNELSALILKLAEQALIGPSEKSSREAVAAALLLTHLAWNRAVDPFGGDQAGHYRNVLEALERRNPENRKINVRASARDDDRIASRQSGRLFLSLCPSGENIDRTDWISGEG